MARPRTGTTEPHGDHFDVRVRLPTGRLSKRIHLAPGLTREQAKGEAAELQRLADAEHGAATRAAAATSTKMLDAWADDWFTDREVRGLASVGDDRSRWRTWVSAVLGGRPVRDVTRAEIEDFVEGLDRAVVEKRVRWKTAVNVWALVSKAFADASNAKTRALRVRDDNPAKGVRGPDRGTSLTLVYLTPAELLQLVNCERVPLVFRRACVLAAYLLVRASELVPLTWDEIDLGAGIVHVHMAQDRNRARKSTKTKRARHVPIEPTLRPLLEAMHREAGGVGRVLPLADGRHLARELKKHLRAAGVVRGDLFVTDATRRALRFHDLRASGITWHAIRGLDPMKIMSRSGHEDFKTMQGYLREAEVLGASGTFGEPFPTLPLEALGVRAPAAPIVPVTPAEPPKKRESREKRGQFVERETGLESAKTEQLRMIDVEIGTNTEPHLCAGDADAYASAAPDRSERIESPAEHGAADRGNAIGRLAGMLVTFAAAGDIEGARAMNDAIARLLGAATGPRAGADVVSLEAERQRRTGR